MIIYQFLNLVNFINLESILLGEIILSFPFLHQINVILEILD